MAAASNWEAAATSCSLGIHGDLADPVLRRGVLEIDRYVIRANGPGLAVAPEEAVTASRAEEAL